MNPSPHQFINPESMPAARGFSHAVVPADGRTVYLAGQVAIDSTGAVVGETFAEQFEVALGNVLAALASAGGGPEHLVSLVMYATDVAAYRAALGEVGAAYRTLVGRHFPAMALVGVTELVEPTAMIEIVGIAVIP
ncbi:MAG: RidA family protein [Actinomycetota bacterium]|nr:RidA family protein [Actinomycetota bacterium]